MLIQIIAVGRKMPTWVEAACEDYLKRMPREIDIQITAIALAQRKAKDSIDSYQRQEAAQIVKKIVPGSFSIALDEQGKQWASNDWAQQLEHWMQHYPRVNLIIGGPDGLDDECRQNCQQTISLGRMTMPHALVRVVLVEQLYRAWSLLKGHPYHRE
ncbi:MAG: 23S rRNA (pseudouridine(1915)-N(3))-methyltransferase RlmH [Proteobacteria bacterium]|nr:23S rRNA (pseudouridine(1915)-N(3))-methyltransferase RlmH [Pseudomonadota bacterium]